MKHDKEKTYKDGLHDAYKMAYDVLDTMVSLKTYTQREKIEMFIAFLEAKLR